MVVVDLPSQSYFFVGAAMSPAGWLHFRFTGMSMMGVCLGGADSLTIGKIVGQAIDGTVLTGANIAVGFSGLSL